MKFRDLYFSNWLIVVLGLEPKCWFKKAFEPKPFFLLYHTISSYLVILVLLLVCWLSTAKKLSTTYGKKVQLLSKLFLPKQIAQFPTSVPQVTPQLGKSKCKNFITCLKAIPNDFKGKLLFHFPVFNVYFFLETLYMQVKRTFG